MKHIPYILVFVLMVLVVITVVVAVKKYNKKPRPLLVLMKNILSSQIKGLVFVSNTMLELLSRDSILETQNNKYKNPLQFGFHARYSLSPYELYSLVQRYLHRYSLYDTAREVKNFTLLSKDIASFEIRPKLFAWKDTAIYKVILRRKKIRTKYKRYSVYSVTVAYRE